ncbi:MAG: hypothetical protein JO020_24965 [Chloroflexi bacterium]|nr:hypothetical protein [Chloroflexota bacterium]
MAESSESALMSVRARAAYSTAEREFSLLLKRSLDDLLQGKRNRLDILRKYPSDAGRLGIIPTPGGFPLDELRLPTLEQLTWHALRFVQSDGDGGPIVQLQDAGGGVVEVQTFPTKYPHIVIERVDHFGQGPMPDSITWSLYRVQNQRAQTQFNRLLDATNLLFELVRLVR